MAVRDILSIGQHGCDHLVGVEFVDRVADPTTSTTWYDAFHRDAFVERITAFVERVGS